jgi:chorismate mutase/prephenate dehydratase
LRRFFQFFSPGAALTSGATVRILGTPAVGSASVVPVSDLDALREEIDRLDEQIVALLNRRARCVQEIGQLKADAGTPVFSPDREQQILDRIRRLSEGPLPPQSLQAIYRELMSASLALERPLRVACLGPAGSFSHEAALGKFGASIEFEPFSDIPGVLEAVARRHADFAVVPVENSVGGAVADTLDTLSAGNLRICCEIHRRIRHHLLARCRLEDIQRVYSRPEAFVQCRKFLAQTGLDNRTVGVASTSKAAELARDETGTAAIAGHMAARIFGLNVLAASIEDSPHNVTRFVVVGRSSARPTGDDKTSLTFLTADRAGALVEVLLVFRRFGVNMSMITSRPSRTDDLEYAFFVDVQGHEEDHQLAAALREVRQHCQRLTILGSYPRSQDVIDD